MVFRQNRPRSQERDLRAELHCVSQAFFSGRPTDVSALVSRFAEFVPLKTKRKKKRTYYIQLPSCHKRDILTPKTFGETESQRMEILDKIQCCPTFFSFHYGSQKKTKHAKSLFCRLVFGSNGFVETTENFGLNYVTVVRSPLVHRLISIWFLSIMFNDNSWPTPLHGLFLDTDKKHNNVVSLFSKCGLRPTCTTIIRGAYLLIKTQPPWPRPGGGWEA